MTLFRIDIHKLEWIDGSLDDPEDLCLHGTYTVVIGNETISDECTISATALYLLKSLTKDHAFGQENQIFPCCGFEMYADERMENVSIPGCPNGVDLELTHVPGGIQVRTERGTQVVVPLDDYRAEVFRLADRIKAFYESCLPKKLPDDNNIRNGYTAFWREWNRRRYERSVFPTEHSINEIKE